MKYKNINEWFDMYCQGQITEEELLLNSKEIISTVIFKRFKGYAKHILEDYIQEGYIITLKIARKHREIGLPEGVSFHTILRNNLWWKLDRIDWEDSLIRKPVYIMEQGAEKSTVLYESHLEEDSIDGRYIYKRVIEPTSVFWLDLDRAIRKLKLNQQQIDAFIGRAVYGYTSTYMAEKLGVSKQHMNAVYLQVRDKLKKEVKDWEECLYTEQY